MVLYPIVLLVFHIDFDDELYFKMMTGQLGLEN